MKMRDVTASIPLVNYSTSRDGHKATAIVLHITADSTKNQSVSHFQNAKSKVSAHYIIEKDGLCIMCVHPSHRAYHAGNVKKPSAKIYFDKGQINPNLYTIGIECVSSGEPLTNEQLLSLKELIITLCDAYKIPRTRYSIIGHNELDSVSRKFDPIKSYSVDDIVKSIEVVSKMTFNEAMQVLIENKVITSEAYWRCAADCVIYLKELMINFAKKIVELKT